MSKIIQFDSYSPVLSKQLIEEANSVMPTLTEFQTDDLHIGMIDCDKWLKEKYPKCTTIRAQPFTIAFMVEDIRHVYVSIPRFLQHLQKAGCKQFNGVIVLTNFLSMFGDITKKRNLFAQKKLFEQILDKYDTIPIK